MLLRETLIELDYEFEREKTHQRYSRIMFAIPLPNMAYVYQFRIATTPPFVVETYDTQPSHSGILHHVAIHGIRPENLDDIRRLFQTITTKLPRKPWQFFWLERFRTGFIHIEYIRARKRWEQLGIS